MSESLSIRLIDQLVIVYEDQYLLAVNKPGGVLSQPGKIMDGSVVTQIKQAHPEYTGPVLVHRLDMDTSGLLLLAKTRVVHRLLQQLFEGRRIAKRYVAILKTEPESIGGRVTLPIRPDIENRPRQIVCEQHGKSAITVWHCASGKVDQRIFLYPHTGRTHQLRVHLSHQSGLGIPIQGDRLYGVADDRLYLHADHLEFVHPMTQKNVVINCSAPF